MNGLNGYHFRRLETEEIPATLAFAVGLDRETDGFVMVDLIIPHYQGAYRFTAQQFMMFSSAVQSAAQMAVTMVTIMDAISDCLEGEEEEVCQRVMNRMGEYLEKFAEVAGGHVAPEGFSEQEEDDES